MKKTFTILIAAIAAMMITLPWKAVGQTTYTFTSKSWEDSQNSWDSDKDATGMDGNNRGVQVHANQSGAGATSKSSFSNITNISINAAKASSASGTIKVYVGNTEVLSKSSSNLSTSSDDYSVDLSASPKTGKVSFVITSTNKSLYLKSITITYSTDPTITIGTPTGGTISVTKTSDGSNISTGLIASGTGITLGVAPNTGYAFTTWNVTKTSDGTPVPLNSEATVASNSFSMPSYNTTVNATFTKQSFNVTLGSPADADLSATDMDEINISEGEYKAVPYGTELVLEAKNMGSDKMFEWKVTKTGVTPEVNVTSTVLSSITATDAVLTVPDYAVTVSGTVKDLKYIVTYKANGGVENDVVEYYSPGVKVTAANNTFTYSGHVFKNWNTDYDGDGTEYAEGATISSSISADITLYAQWADAWTVTLSSNGSTTITEVEKTQSITLSSPASVPSGFVYKGWTGTPEYPFNMVSSDFTPTKDTTLYAVFAKTDQEYVERTVILDGSFLTTTATSSVTSKTVEGFTYTISDGAKQTAVQNTASNEFDGITTAILIGKSGKYIYNTTPFGNGITKFEVYANKGVSENVTVGVFFKTTSIESYSTGTNTWTQKFAEDTQYDASSKLPDGAKYFWFQVTNAYNAQVAFRITYIAPVYYVRIYPSETFNADSDITINTPTLIQNGTTLNMGSHTLTCTNADNLIIEEGGQLKLTNGTANVQATMKRNVAAWTGTVPDKGDEDNAGWYAIASPVNGLAISSFAQGTHNVYSYDEPTAYWHEYHSILGESPAYNNLTSGVGYLYRSTVAGLEFKGVLNAGDASGNVSPTLSYANSTNANLKGFNLVGNPFSHNISWSDMTKTDIGEGYYLLDEDPDSPTHGKWGASTTGTIAPTQAFLVKAASASALLTIKNNLPAQQGKGEQANHDNIMFSISNGSQSDEAYVLFKEGYGLNKISHRNSKIPMLYVIDNGTNYAVATMPDNTQSFMLGFEAKTTGKYTLSFKANGEFNYLHVIDRLTGEDIDMLLEGEYSFIGSPMDNANRFIVRLGYLPNYDDNGEDNFAYQSGSDVVVSGEGELQIFDVMGRMIATQRINGVETINLSTNGVYIFRLNGNTQKIVVK